MLTILKYTLHTKIAHTNWEGLILESQDRNATYAEISMLNDYLATQSNIKILLLLTNI